MTWDDQPIQPAQPPPPQATRVGGLHRGAVVGTMALALLALGGVAAVSAADPSALPTARSTTTEQSDEGAGDQSTGRVKGDCPEDGANPDNGATSPDASPDTSPDASPDDSPDASSSDA
jgi:hypothetical protein